MLDPKYSSRESATSKCEGSDTVLSRQPAPRRVTRTSCTPGSVGVNAAR
jgi:hypothetical protein